MEEVNSSFEVSLLFWHSATEFLYEKTSKEEATSDEKTCIAREFSKVLSDYMMYLLVLKPTMLNSKANFRLETLRDEAKIYLQGKITQAMREKVSSSVYSAALDQAERMVDKLQSLDYLKDKKWEIVSKVWVELISYAACRSRSTRTHVQQVSNGGELFTFVWVLMAHLVSWNLNQMIEFICNMYCPSHRSCTINKNLGYLSLITNKSLCLNFSQLG